MIRDDIKTGLIDSMKAKDSVRVAAIRLIQAAIKNRDIEARTGGAPADDDVLVMEVLGKMAKQRRESIEMFEKGNRPELAAAEQSELEVIESFLPKQMSEEEAKAAIAALVTEAGATSVKDMGAVMALVKARLQGQIDMSKASGMVKAALG
ncbi:GatB/YqeY domain-containing protein [Sandaracinobacter neustonicus]|uniref:GatB/YqeY domain-containing protein n=1 Tax=Sandaracinobacter neustonicus TaxID=1715348 RepID=A0A501XEJ8_9SPHN|nr:GatB/YqeY domain-containing protein [Sandaracinobacter neustonicus]TPE58724.1 GatB/YqeY domain-containing protein [Sandaracinobacter neustonicus]